MPCCCICISISHRKCENVVTLEDAAKGMSSSPRVHDLKEDLKKMANDVETVIGNQKCNLQQFENQFEKEQKSIEDTFHYLRDKLNQQEELRKAELWKIFNAKKDIIETKITIFENKRKSIENEQKLLDVSSSKASDSQLLIELNKLQCRRDQHKEDFTAVCADLHTFTLALKNTDISVKEKQIESICRIQCKAKACTFLLESVKGVIDKIHKFNRFTKLGTEMSPWSVTGAKSDAVAFTVSEKISLVGFTTYGCRNNIQELEIEVKVKRGIELMADLNTFLAGNEFKDNITKIYLENPVDIFPAVQYEVVFLMKSKHLYKCNFGENGQKEVNCEGINFKFCQSSNSANGTDDSRGQIPGLLFRKYKF